MALPRKAAKAAPHPEPGGAPDAPVLRAYAVRAPLKHDGVRYRPDDPQTCTIRLSEAQAEVLQAIGVLGEAEPDA